MSTTTDTYSSRDALETERDAYNSAFSDLGLDWYWDSRTYAELRASSQEKSHVRCYLEAHRPHLLRAYDAEFLVNAIESRRRQITRPMTS